MDHCEICGKGIGSGTSLRSTRMTRGVRVYHASCIVEAYENFVAMARALVDMTNESHLTGKMISDLKQTLAKTTPGANRNDRAAGPSSALRFG